MMERNHSVSWKRRSMSSKSHTLLVQIRTRSLISFFLFFVMNSSGQTSASAATPPPPVPTTFQDLYTLLNGDLNTFNTTLNSLWNRSKYPVVFAEKLKGADANTGPTVISQMSGI